MMMRSNLAYLSSYSKRWISSTRIQHWDPVRPTHHPSDIPNSYLTQRTVSIIGAPMTCTYDN